MIRCVLYAPQREDGKLLSAALREQAALETDQEVECRSFSVAGEAVDCLRKQGAALIGWDVSKETARQQLSAVRGSCREAFLLALAVPETSPLTFLRPDIAPNSMAICPLTRGEARRAAGEMLQAALREDEAPDGACFSITSREGQKYIPFSSIYYFEARDRKLYARLQSEEWGFAGTLDRLEEELPEEFQRCHRSFVVNMIKVDQILLTENMIYLRNGLAVPLSRSFKRTVKERSHGKY